jgi:hypothetical protein
MLAVVMLSRWVPIAVFSGVAVYCVFFMVDGGRWAEAQLRRRERSPRFVKVLYSIFSFGQWRNLETMKAWGVIGALFGFIGSVAVVILFLFFVHPTQR